MERFTHGEGHAWNGSRMERVTHAMGHARNGAGHGAIAGYGVEQATEHGEECRDTERSVLKQLLWKLLFDYGAPERRMAARPSGSVAASSER